MAIGSADVRSGIVPAQSGLRRSGEQNQGFLGVPAAISSLFMMRLFAVPAPVYPYLILYVLEDALEIYDGKVLADAEPASCREAAC